MLQQRILSLETELKLERERRLIAERRRPVAPTAGISAEVLQAIKEVVFNELRALFPQASTSGGVSSTQPPASQPAKTNQPSKPQRSKKQQPSAPPQHQVTRLTNPSDKKAEPQSSQQSYAAVAGEHPVQTRQPATRTMDVQTQDFPELPTPNNQWQTAQKRHNKKKTPGNSSPAQPQAQQQGQQNQQKLKQQQQRPKQQQQTEQQQAKQQQQQPKQQQTTKKRHRRRMQEDKKSVLFLPSNPGEKVVDTLKQMINPRMLNVVRTVQFPSGAALIQCGTVAEAADLKATASLHRTVKVKEPKQFTASFRIHQVESITSVEDLQEDLQKQLGHRAASIIFVPYKEESKKDLRIAVCEASPALLNAAEKKATLRVGWSRCRIDASIRLPRCTKCHLLGHVVKHCRNEARPAPTGKEPCFDCSCFNASLQKAHLPRQMKRTTDHPTNHGTCTTKNNLLRKHRRWQSTSEVPTSNNQEMDVGELGDNTTTNTTNPNSQDDADRGPEGTPDQP